MPIGNSSQLIRPTTTWPSGPPTGHYTRYAVGLDAVGVYVPAELARFLAPILDAGEQLHSAAVEVRIREESPEWPGVTASLRRVDAIR